MTKKRAVIFSIIIHIIIAAAFIILKFERKKVNDQSPIELEYTFVEKPKPSKKDESVKTAVKKHAEIPLPPVELPEENNEITSSTIIADSTFSEIRSLAVMPKDTLADTDSLLFEDKSLLALRTLFMNRVADNTPEDTSKKWKQIAPVSIEEYLELMKYKDGFNNAKMQDELNSGGIKIPLDAIFDLFD
jgi:hypothetical protein